MKHRPLATLSTVFATLALTAAVASASMMHSHLTAKLSGMGDHGSVNLTLNSSSGKVCWTFDLPMVRHITLTAVHTGSNGAVLIEFGMHYTKSGCEHVSAMTLEHVEAHPSSYWVWVNTTGHPGDLRGHLYAGMAHM
jgi:hypothetical protein